MRLHELVAARTPNPLNGGKVPTEVYHAMDVFDDIEVDLLEEITYLMPGTDIYTRTAKVREIIHSLGTVKEVPIAKLIPLEPDYDAEFVKQGVKSEPAEVYYYIGKYYITNGNHRVISAHLSGKTSVKVLVIDTQDIVDKTDEFYFKRTEK